ncbi:MAG TPA: phosphate ABC transporter permease PstA [Longilinea sp.]|nr:phosphate ABC transporter permease PstA [Longilinea sp.]
MSLFSNGSLSTQEYSQVGHRHRIGKVWEKVFLFSTILGVAVLVILLASILNQTVGLIAVINDVDPETLSAQPLETLDSNSLITILQSHLSGGRLRTLNREQPLIERSQSQLYQLVVDTVVEPQVQATWLLSQSLFSRSQIEAQVAVQWPSAHLEWRSWLNLSFLVEPMNSDPLLAGVRTSLLGSLYLIIITIIIAFPIGIGAAIYLEEYADKTNKLNKIIQTNIDNLSGVPSIVYGILGLAIFVRLLSSITSGSIFGVEDGNGRTLLSAGFTMALLVLPVLIINTQEAIRAVPNSIRQASYGLGATQWQTIWNHVLPAALPGILTGSILAISRAIGETAPLIVVGAATYVITDPNGPFSVFTALPIQIYNWTTRPQPEWRNLAASAIVVLMVMLLSMNTAAILLRNRFQKRL